MSISAHERDREVRDTLAYIRETMESASSFTAVSGWGLVAVGVIGLVASWLAMVRGAPTDLVIWVPAAVLSISVSMALTAAKARRKEARLWSASFRKLVWILAPALVAGALLTAALWTRGITELLPGTWLAAYGAGVAAGGTYSIRAFRWLGLIFLMLGAAALLDPGSGLPLLATGFGGLHLLFGFHIVRNYGG